MEIPLATLSLLSCAECGAVLSRGPVFQAHDGAALCGRCVRADRPTSRNKLYEAVAQLLRFPCKNRELGCTYTVPFTLDNEDVAHEDACPYRQYLCPVVPRGQCEWLGTRREMLEHCEAEHPGKVVRNGVQQTHDITKSSQNTYLLYAFHMLFLLHTKVCVTTGKIFHSIRMLSDQDSAAKFAFTVDIKRGKFFISKSYPVAAAGCLAMQEDTSLAMGINSLLEILDGFKGTEFTVTVYDTTGCVECGAELKQYYYSKLDGWLCEKCAPAKRSCEYKEDGCTHMDVDNKCKNHETFFCSYSRFCNFCENEIYEKMNAHFNSTHLDIIRPSGSEWRNTTLENGKAYIITAESGYLRCRSWSYDFKYELVITSDLSCEDLHEYYCEIKLTHPTTNQSKTYRPNILYNQGAVWLIRVDPDEFKSYNGLFDITVTVERIY